jgi:DNA-binding Xre family transcriptional regulator
MLKFNFQRLFKARGIEKPFSYMVRKGFSKNYATRVNTGKMKMMNLKDVEEMCEFLECTPNDLLEWTPNKNVADASMHPLKDLVRVDTSVNIKAILNAIPISQLAEVEKYILEKVKK